MNKNLPIVYIGPKFTIYVSPVHFQARYHGMSLVRVKPHPDGEDLFTLPLNGILKLSKEFAEELEVEENPYPTKTP